MYAHPSSPFNVYLHPAMASWTKAGFKGSAPLAIKARDLYEEQKARAAHARQCRKLKRDLLAKQGDLFALENAPQQDPNFFVAGVVAPREAAMHGSQDYGD